ncbi:MAG: DsbA family oxidoreductase [bacterium]|nr:DsbA family oxidoreductase [bacterium]
MTEPLKVDIWSDIACPWCYVGKRRFAEGVRRYEAAGGQRPIEVEYHSYELSPGTPVDYEGSHVDFLANHLGVGKAQAEQMLTQMTDLAASEGLDFDYDALKSTKTLKAHELLHLAKAHGLQSEMKERLMKAYFVEGRHVGRIDELADLAVEVGLDRDEVVAVLNAGTYANDVRADIDQAQAYGINGVPFYVIDGKYGVSGAQDPSIFVQALDQAAAEGVNA